MAYKIAIAVIFINYDTMTMGFIDRLRSILKLIVYLQMKLPELDIVFAKILS